MVNRVEREVSFQTRPESVFPIREYPAEFVGQVDEWLKATIESTGITWENGGGGAPGAFFGLSQRLSDNLAQSEIPQCCEECTLDVSIIANSGNADEASLVLECPLFSAKTKKEARTIEDRCLKNHELTKEKFAEFVTSTMTEVKKTKKKINRSNTNIEKAERDLRGLL